MKTLVCVILLALGVLAKEEEKAKEKPSVSKRGFIESQIDASTLDISTLDHATGGAWAGGVATGSTHFHETSPWEYGSGHHLYMGDDIGSGTLLSQQSVVHKPVPVPVPHSVPVKVDRPVPFPVPVPQPYPVKVEKHYPVPVVKEVPYPVVKEVPYPVVKLVPYPVEKLVPYPVVKKVPYPVHIRIDRPYPVPVHKPYPVPVVKRILYPVEKTVHYPVRITEKVPVPHPVPFHIPRPYPVAVPHPVPVPYDRPYPVKVIKPVPIPYERKIPVPVHVPVQVPVQVPKPYPVPVPHPVHVPGPVIVGSTGSVFEHGTSSHDFSSLFASQQSYDGHGGVECYIQRGFPISTGSLISNSGAIVGPTQLSALAEQGASVPSEAGTRFESRYFNLQKPPIVTDLLPGVDATVADSSSIVEIKKSVEIPAASKVSRSPGAISTGTAKSASAAESKDTTDKSKRHQGS